MSAKFRVDAVFSVEGRGTVIQGTIVNGEVSHGMHIVIPGGERIHRIAAVDGIHSRRIPIGSLGLVLEDSTPDDVSAIAALSEGKVLDIE